MLLNLSRRNFGSQLKKKLAEYLPQKIEDFKTLKTQVTGKIINEVKGEQIMSGMRGIKGIFYETSRIHSEHVYSYNIRVFHSMVTPFQISPRKCQDHPK